MKKIILVFVAMILVVCGYKFVKEGDDVFNKNIECVKQKEIISKYAPTDQFNQMTEIFYSPKLKTCLAIIDRWDSII